MSEHLKSEQKKPIYLIGMMGSWKTTAGKLLAEKLGLSFTDIDDKIKEEEGKSIREIFEQEGKQYFRELETEMLKKVSKSRNSIIATGGGIILNETNREIMTRTGFVIMLEANPESIAQRINNVKKRPVLQSDQPLLPQLESIWSERKPFYEKAADITIETNDLTPAMVVEKLAKTVKEFYANH